MKPSVIFSTLCVLLLLTPLRVTSAAGENFVSDQAVVTGETYVGAVPGSHSVDRGALTYEIPIRLAPGAPGSAIPKLSIEYSSSHSGNVLGADATLKGLTSIHRCPRNPAQDGGRIRAVQYDEGDAYCLDHHRLVAVNGGVYGGNGTEYRLEVDVGMKIVSYALTAGSPYCFHQFTRDGERLFFGCAEDATVSPQGRPEETVNFWLLHRREDSAGNYAVFSYGQSDDSDEYWIDRISYGGNSRVNQDPFNEVQFAYKPRADVVPVFHQGSKLQTRRLLSNVTVRSGGAIGAIATTTKLEYTQDCLTQKSRLQAVTTCDSEGKCLPPTWFQWTALPCTEGQADLWESVPGAPSRVPSGGSLEQQGVFASSVLKADFNGDGKMDTLQPMGLFDDASILAGTRASRIVPQNPQGDGWLAAVDGPELPVRGAVRGLQMAAIDLARIKLVDINHDGAMDIYYVNGWGNDAEEDVLFLFEPTTDGSVTWTPYSGLSTVVRNSVQLANYDLERIMFGDFDGNALIDVYIVTLGNTPDEIYLNIDGKSWSQTPLLTSFASEVNPLRLDVDLKRFRLTDLNGDGRTDVYIVVGWGEAEPATDAVWMNHWEPAEITSPTGGGTPPVQHVPFDLFTGPETSVRSTTAQALVDFQRIVLAPMNGDGLLDIYHFGAGGADSEPDTIWLNLGNGSWTRTAGISSTVRGPVAEAQIDLQCYMSLDINNDGLADIVELRRASLANPTVALPALVHLNTGIVDSMFGVPIEGPRLMVGALDTVARRDFQLFSFIDMDGNSVPDVYHLQPAASEESAQAGDEVLMNPMQAVVLQSITDGLGKTIQATFKPLSDPSVYTADPKSAVYPARSMRRSVLVLAQLDVSDGVGGQSTTYRYGGGKTHMLGFGDLGYAHVQATDQSTGISTRSMFSQDYEQRLQNQVWTTASLLPNGVVRSNQTWSHSVNKTLHMGSDGLQHPTFGITTPDVWHDKRGLSGEWLSSSVTHTSAFDQFMNPLHTVSTVTDPFGEYTKEVTTKYSPLTDNNAWHVDMVASRTTNHTAAGKASIVHDVAYTRDPVTGFITKEVFFGGTEFERGHIYDHDLYGNVVAKYQFARGRQRLTEEVWFDATGSHVIRRSNALGYEERQAISSTFGVATATWDVNGLSTNSSLDGLGRVLATHYPDGTISRMRRLWCSPSKLPSVAEEPGDIPDCPANAVLVKVATPHAGSVVVSYHDLLGRTIRTAKPALGATRWVFVDTIYTAHGEVGKKSAPYFEDEEAQWTVTEFNVLGAPVFVQLPDGNITTMSYYGHSMKTTNSLGLSHNTSSNAMGWSMYSRDPLGGTAWYDYTSSGQQFNVTDALGNSILSTFNLAGQLVSVDDPDMGILRYEYDIWGNMAKQFSQGTGRMISYGYDALNRKVNETTMGGGLEAATAQWVYDECEMGIMKLCAAWSGDGLVQDMIQYNHLGLPVKTTRETEGFPVQIGGLDTMKFKHTLTFLHSFDSKSRVNGTVYPGGSNPESTDYSVNTSFFSVGWGVIAAVLCLIGITTGTLLVVERSDRTSATQKIRTVLEEIHVLRHSKLDGSSLGYGTLASNPSSPKNQGRGKSNGCGDRRLVRRILVAVCVVSITLSLLGLFLTFSLPEENVAAVHVGGLATVFEYDNTTGRVVAIHGNGTVLYKIVEENAFGSAVKIHYNDGKLVQIRDTDSMNRVRRITTTTSTGVVLQDLAYDYDAIRNVISRTDNLRGLRETVDIDDLNRVTASRVVDMTSGQQTSSQAFEYDLIGNLKFKSNVGQYEHNSLYSLDEQGAPTRRRPHAVSQTSGGPVSSAYIYDGAGNMVAGNGRQLVYNGFDKPSIIQSLTTGSVTQLSYDADHNLARRLEDDIETLTAGGGLFERVQRVQKLDGDVPICVDHAAAENILQHRYLVDNFAQYTSHEQGGSRNVSLVFILRDLLGSVDKLVAENGTVVEERSYDIFGLRRHPDTWDDFLEQGDSNCDVALTDRGFTDHIQLDRAQIVFMRARVYDALLGVFLQPDSIIQDVSNGQSLNRYSYVLNNPLTLTDPTGHFSFGKFFHGLFSAIGHLFHEIGHALGGLMKAFKHSALLRGAIEAIMDTAASFLCGPICAMEIDACYSAVVSKIEGASFLNALECGAITFATDFAFYECGELAGPQSKLAASLSKKFGQAAGQVATQGANVAAHAVVGGAASAARGGNFWSGAASGAVGDISSMVGAGIGGDVGTVVGGALGGGMSSVVTGGNFADGALTGAEGAVFNSLAHDVYRIMQMVHERTLEGVRDGKIKVDPTSRLGAFKATLGYRYGTVGYAINNAIATLYVDLGNFGQDQIGTVFNSAAMKALYNQPVSSKAGLEAATLEYHYWKTQHNAGGQLGSMFHPQFRDKLQKHLFSHNYQFCGTLYCNVQGS